MFTNHDSNVDSQPLARLHPPAIAGYPQAGHVLVSFVVSFVYVRNRPVRIMSYGQSRSRPLATLAEPRRADLESVLGASPREFESRILRRADLQERPSRPMAG